ncbi:cytochrome P450 [Corynebacterium amycolatum]|uniref:Cytochrome P450 n=1 Tax=Corynebacterium amycolatum TaxID=43765 RepID=A0AB37GBQ3_CORAY|nr:cytochrome P450 [Corynebacterium amycolatum]QPR31414.1 cytochrome P450 [Corynebacterium amycolatum]QQB83294.1 cytochrome P450 [Corynebacterium amycolatum]QQV00861.1 cytochrome P450 [Corynebacterium amycolatum]
MSETSFSEREVESPYMDVAPQRTCPFSPPVEFVDASRNAPIVPWDFHAGHRGWLVTGNVAAKQILADKRFSVRVDLASTPGAPTLRHFDAPGLFHMKDDPDHSRLRKAVNREFAPARIRAFEPTMEAIAEERLQRLLASGPGSDFITSVSIPYSIGVVCSYLEIPESVSSLLVQQAAVAFRKQEKDDNRIVAMQQVYEVLGSLVRERRQRPTGDMISRLLKDESINAEEVVGIVAQVLIAGFTVPAAMFGFAMYAIMEHPGGITELIGEGKTEATVNELFRYVSFEAQPRIRVATEDAEVCGITIEEGQLVAIAIDVANRDFSIYQDPDRLLPERSIKSHLGFSWGAHQCLGRSLAISELIVLLNSIAAKIPAIRIAEGTTPTLADDGIARAVARMPVEW